MAKETETKKSNVELLDDIIRKQAMGYMLTSVLIHDVLNDEDVILTDSDRDLLSKAEKTFDKLVSFKIENIKAVE